jgi:hypothetical protein
MGSGHLLMHAGEIHTARKRYAFTATIPETGLKSRLPDKHQEKQMKQNVLDVPEDIFERPRVKRPVRDFFSSIKHRLSEAKQWIIHRTIDRYDFIWLHDLRPGYHEPETRMFHSMMQILCDFVEIELAHHRWACRSDRDKHPKPKKRDREAGLAHLDWEISLKLDEHMGVYPGEESYGGISPQALAAMEVKAIYLWYRDVFQKRLEEGEESGLYACASHTGQEWESACKRHRQLEEDHEAEDTQYMKRLIDVRRSMWT